MFLNVHGLRIHFKISGEGPPVVLLHGWGCSLEIFDFVHRHLEKCFRICSLDFPGFGQSEVPDRPWGTEEYSELVISLCEALDIRDPVFIGHSFGGRVAIRLGADQKAKKLLLIDSAGIKPRKSLKYFFKVYAFKTLRLFFRTPFICCYADQVLNHFLLKTGSFDYYNAQGTLRTILVKVANEDLKDELKKIKVPTLLIWGDLDQPTPVRDGQLMEKMIPNSALIVFKGAGHFSFFEQPVKFLRIVDRFLSSD